MLLKMATSLRICSRRLANMYRARAVVAGSSNCIGIAQRGMLSLERGIVMSSTLRPTTEHSFTSVWNSRRWYGAGTAITAEELKERILNVLKLFDKVNAEKVTLEAHFINDLGLDSLDAVEIVMAFEDEFAVEISDEEAEKILSCNDAFELLKAKIDIH